MQTIFVFFLNFTKLDDLKNSRNILCPHKIIFKIWMQYLLFLVNKYMNNF